jgi:DNA invertase Pin-like site-specific DNA recombinase
MFLGYARVSTADQDLALQRDALKAAGCARIFTDTITGTSTERPGLSKALAALSAGDTLIVWKLDRLGRSLAHLVQLIADLGTRGIGFRSLSDPIDTESLIVERTQAGLQAAKRRGRKLGRPIKLTAAQVEHARALLASGENGSTVARSFGVARSTLYVALKPAPMIERIDH